MNQHSVVHVTWETEGALIASFLKLPIHLCETLTSNQKAHNWPKVSPKISQFGTEFEIFNKTIL